jgi:hypothetical protein
MKPGSFSFEIDIARRLEWWEARRKPPDVTFFSPNGAALT